MSDRTTEVQRSQEAISSVENIANSTYRVLSQDHHLVSPPDISTSLFAGYSEREMIDVFGQLGVTIEGGLQTACALTINQNPYEQLIWIDTSHPAIDGLKNYTDYGFEKHKLGYSIVAEEVSHFLYKDAYFAKYGKEPPEWMVEMTGALDKYNLFQRMSLLRSGRPMNAGEAQEADKIIYTALHYSGAPEDHTKGHSEAKRVAQKLNNLANAGTPHLANSLFDQIYNSDEHTVKQILSSLPV